MSLRRTGDGGVHNGRGSFANVVFTTDVILNFFALRSTQFTDNFLCACIFYHACGYFIRRADNFLARAHNLSRVWILIELIAL